jgi:hypothetical protein
MHFKLLKQHSSSHKKRSFANTLITNGYDYVAYCADDKWTYPANMQTCNNTLETSLGDAFNALLNKHGIPTMSCWIYYYDMDNLNEHPYEEFYNSINEYIRNNPNVKDLDINQIALKTLSSNWPVPSTCICQTSQSLEPKL